MLRFAFKSMAVRRTKLIMTALSVILAAGVALLAYNISTQVSEGIVNTAAKYDIIIGPPGSATQLAMNTMFFTDKPLGTVPYALVEELRASGMVNDVVPFSMGDSYNAAPIVGTEPRLLQDKPLKTGEMFAAPLEAVAGSAVARAYGLKPGDKIVSSHGLSSTGAAHTESPLTVVGVLAQTNTAYDNAVFTPVSTIWALHDHGGDGKAEEAEEENHEGEAGDEGETHTEESHAESHSHEVRESHDGQTGDVCAVLVRSKSLADYSALMAAYGSDSGYLAINPNTVLREVMENVDLSRRIVYILCAIILVMNLFVVSVIALLNMYDSREEIALMRLIGIGMGKINQLYLLQNALAGAAAMVLSLAFSRLCLWAMKGFVARMGIVLNAAHVYPMELLICLAVFVVSILPTAILTRRMAGRDGIAS